MALILAAAWAVAAASIGLGFGAFARRAAVRLPASKASSQVRRAMRAASLVNLALAAGLALSLSVFAGISFSSGTMTIFGGICFMLAVGIAEWHLGNQIFPAFEKVRPGQLTSRAFRFRLMATAMSIALPLGVSAILIGSLIHVAAGAADAGEMVAKVLAMAVAATLWWLQWGAIRVVLLPGKPADFPMPDWEEDAKNLAMRMGTTLNDLLILRTGKSRVAGAFAIGGGRIAITDDLLAVLSHEEFLAVMAHELRHFAQRRRTALTAGLLVVAAGSVAGLAAWAAAVEMMHRSLAFGVALGAAAGPVLPLTRMRRRNEDDADLAAIRAVGARPLMLALSKTYAVNGRLNDASAATVHRGLRDRLLQTAIAGGLRENAVDEAFEAASSALSSPQVSFSR